MVWYFSLLEKDPKSHFEPIDFALLVFFYLSFSRGRATSKKLKLMNISKNQNLYPQQSQITYHSLR